MNGFWERVVVAFQCFLSILFRAEVPRDIAQKLVKPVGLASPAPAATAPSVSHLKEVQPPASEEFDRAVQMLALLQRDGRLVDFLAEDISAYPDVQLGAAVRTIHDTCRQALDQYVKLEPIMNSEEDQPVPVRGVLRHKGWRAKEVSLPPLQQAAGRMVIAPAEVELL